MISNAFKHAYICLHTLTYAYIRFYMHAKVTEFANLLALTCIMSSLEQQQQEEMTLTLCITGFCFAEAGKNVPF